MDLLLFRDDFFTLVVRHRWLNRSHDHAGGHGGTEALECVTTAHARLILFSRRFNLEVGPLHILIVVMSQQRLLKLSCLTLLPWMFPPHSTDSPRICARTRGVKRNNALSISTLYELASHR